MRNRHRRVERATTWQEIDAIPMNDMRSRSELALPSEVVTALADKDSEANCIHLGASETQIERIVDYFLERHPKQDWVTAYRFVTINGFSTYEVAKDLNKSSKTIWRRDKAINEYLQKCLSEPWVLALLGRQSQAAVVVGNEGEDVVAPARPLPTLSKRAS